MSDVISRQVAISAICSACGKIDCDKMDKCEKLQLPPANCSEFPNSSDTISRQQAIEALMNALNDVGVLDAEDINTVFQMLPPSQLGTNLAEVGTDCISRQAVIDALRGYLVGKRCPDDGTLTCRLIENEVINKLPPAQPKTGKWALQSDDYHEYYECDQCGMAVGLDDVRNFCPNCGAEMEETE